MNEIGEQVAAEPLGEAELTKLVAEYYEVVQDDIHKDRDCHWQLVERFSYGKRVGWFVDHNGYVYELSGCEYGEDGPYPTREEAAWRMAEHLRLAIEDARECQGG
ncbi:MAG TPA: hypothetical protein VNY83_05185 [Solirubrobacterales bacterium]|jgi:hypothetical protein|nr:hypothetical protein [Solirubrobacterales bacterium]